MGNRVATRQRIRRRRARTVPLAEPIESRLLLSTFTVTTTADSGTGSLRTAISSANSHAGDDTIVFDPVVFAPGSLHTITLTTSQLSLTDTVGLTTIQGPGSDVVAISGNNARRVFQINTNVSCQFSGMTITAGLAQGNGATNSNLGGGILNQGTLTLSSCSVTNNAAKAGTMTDASGGALYVQNQSGIVISDCSFSNDSAVFGGAIYLAKGGSFNNCTLTGNSISGSSRLASAIYTTGGSISIVGCTLSGNTGGVAIYASSTSASFQNSSINSNQGGVSFASNASAIISFDTCTFVNTGWAIYCPSAKSLSVANCTISGNSVTNSPGGGGIYCQGVKTFTLTNTSLLQNSSQTAGGALYMIDTFATISYCTFSGNLTNNANGAALVTDTSGSFHTGSLALSNCIFSGNVATQGGGGAILNGLNYGQTPITIDQCTFSDNQSDLPGGAIESYLIPASGLVNTITITNSSFIHNTSVYAYGGAIFSKYQTIVLTNCSFLNNQTPGNNVGGGGAAVYMNPDTFTITGCAFSGNAGTLNILRGDNTGGGAITAIGSNGTISNCTIDGNSSAGNTGAGGGIFFYNTTAAIASCTVANNFSTGVSFFANVFGGGITVIGTGTVTLSNNLIANNTQSINRGPDLFGNVSTLSSHNLIGILDSYSSGITNGVNGNLAGTSGSPLNPQIGTLSSNGGPTQTIPLLANSPALNAGDNSAATAAGLTTDQRGSARFVGPVDIGAYEMAATLSADPSDNTKTALFLGGSASSDTFTTGASGGNLLITIAGLINETYSFPVASITGSLNITALGSDDTLRMTNGAALSSGAISSVESMDLQTGSSLKLSSSLGLKTLSIDNASRLDIASNSVVINYTGASPVNMIRQYLINGRAATDGFDNGETWNGASGISSSVAAQNVFQFGIGYAENSDMPFSVYTSFAGQSVGSSSILIKYTRNGDTDLNGVVDDTDVGAIVTYYKKTNPSSAQWAYGDMDYDGQVDDDDVTAMATFYNPNAMPVSQAFSAQPISFPSAPGDLITNEIFGAAPSLFA